jgi:DNA repair protein RadC
MDIQPYCSTICQNSLYHKRKLVKILENGSNNEHIVSRNKTVLMKYGNLENIINIQEKVESCLKKYGVEYITQTDSYKEKKKYIKKNMDQKHIIIPKNQN